jgi:tetratricopeptide (TPR) repeat protein
MTDINPDPLPKALNDTVLLPGDAEASALDAAALFASGQAEQALDIVSHALTLNPDDRKARVLRARICLQRNDVDLAIEDLELLVCAPAAGASGLEMAEIWTVLGQSYLARKELVGAMLAVDVARKYEPAYPEAAHLSLSLEQAKAGFEDLKED